MIDAAFVQQIANMAVEAAAVTEHEIRGRIYTDRPLHELVQKKPEPSVLTVHTLTGLEDYISSNKDGLDLGGYLLHVVGPDRVDLTSATQGDYHQRFTYVTARNFDRLGSLTSFRFGQFIDLETFNVALQALFDPTDDREKVLRLIGSVSEDATVVREDDGVTQKVTARAGVVLKETVPVPNPVWLAPFRTFPEINQPISPFVLRVKKQGDGITAALFEADGGAWRNEAIYLIRERLGSTTNGISIIA